MTEDTRGTTKRTQRLGRRNDLRTLGALFGRGDAKVGQHFQADVRLESLTYVIDVIVVSHISEEAA